MMYWNHPSRAGGKEVTYIKGDGVQSTELEPSVERSSAELDLYPRDI
jgi:hypothetical protein